MLSYRPDVNFSNHLCAFEINAINLESGLRFAALPGARTIIRTAIPHRFSCTGTSIDVDGLSESGASFKDHAAPVRTTKASINGFK